MRRKIITALILVLAGLLSLYLRPDTEQTRTGFAMNTIIRMTVYAKNDDSLDNAFNLLNSLDSSLSMYNPSSDISRINSLAGHEKYYAPPEVIEVISDSLGLYEITEGVFNPLIGPVTKLWKINRQDNTIPSKESLNAALSLSSIENLELASDSVYLKSEGCILDLGGIAKGYASEKIADMLRAEGITSGIIDLGGNVYALGKNPDGSNWNIGIRDPLDPKSTPAAVLSVSDCAVITSGNYERYKIVDGKKYSHFFDSKTGSSILNDMLSVTLVTPEGSLADGLATAFMISGYEKAIRTAQKLSPMPGIIMMRQDDNGGLEIIASRNMKGIITKSKYQVKLF